MEGGIVGARKPQKAFITTKEQYFSWKLGGRGVRDSSNILET